ncbi:hypothetical protein GCM10009422_11720 [Brevundimonas kwangchunensis]|uniref:Serine/threonine protein kinase n=1 Tax=Brevundimonas kwangchunensis TaxID=322163 RepID=A0ABP3S097_9CAUL
MAEPGDPKAPADHPDDHDDLIGFSSAASLHGRAREVEPAPEPVAEPEPAVAAAEPERAPPPEPEPDLFTPRAEVRPEPEPEPAPVIAPAPAPRPAQAQSIFEASPEFASKSRRRPLVPEAPGSMGLYAVYALILFAVPTLGVSAVVGLLAVTGREGPDLPPSRSHFVYQQRTLWAAAVAAVAGVILLAAPFALGVPVLFLLALWTVIRGASGVWNLKSGKAISDPRSWWI